VKAWVDSWGAALGTVLALPVLFVPVLLFALTGPPWGYVLAAASVTVMAVVMALPSWIGPLRKADPHDGESILQSIRRHYRRLRS
jgi:hypothetical protein